MDETETLTARLHRLEAVFAPLASSYAHPRELEEQPQFVEAVGLLQGPDVPLSTVMQYVTGTNWTLACAALATLVGRPDRDDAVDDVLAHFDKLYPWPIYFALAYFAVAEPRPPVGAPVVGAKDWWCENVILPGFFRDYLAQRERLGDEPAFGSALQATYASPPGTIKAFLQKVNHPHAAALIRQLDTFQRASIDRTFLSSFGRFWADRKELELLVEPEAWREALSAAESAALQTPTRSLLVSGDHRVGKTAFLRLLANRLEGEGWEVFEAGGADLMAGQQWFGQLEGRIQRTVEELAASKKLIWYIPDILQLARSGTHQGQAASILDQILPAVSSGRLIVWTEATAAGTARLVQFRPMLRSVLEVVRLEPQSQEETSALALAFVQRLANETDLAVSPECVPVALNSARQYLSAANFPGSVLDLIKLTANRVLKSDSREVEAREVIVTLSQLTGLPVSILDSNERVDLASIRDYFTARVIGQNEAVAAIVDRIAMLKAGLNDPGKPIGVFLFAGSTGTGKTELAKTAAEYLFGSVDRMIRLDMSEFQTPETTHKILGGEDVDSLVNRVRKQPFSVVLLDEFEKAHAAIWDLFLQVFDDGRLTDAMGHVADFRHCMIILTTNLGATSHRTSGLGFAPTADAFSNDQIMRAIGQTFRPEFQNRLDKVIVFHPLNRDLMREILKKELGRVLERRGLKYRDWAVEWEASAQEFLLEKGFSAEMGARPLKRAIDQYLIAPLAATIVERRFPEGDQFVFVRSDGRAIQAEFVDPDGDAPRESGIARGGRRGQAARAAGDDPGGDRIGGRGQGSRPRARRRRGDVCLAAMGGPEGEPRRPHDGRRFLVAARPPRHAGAARPDGPRQDGGRHGRGLARAARQGQRADRQAFARAGGAAGPAAAPHQGRHQGHARGGADRGGAQDRAGHGEAERASGDARLVPAIAGHVPRLGRQPAHAADKDRRRRAQSAVAADQRLRRPPPARAGDRPARAGGRRGEGPGGGARAPRGGAARRPGGRQAARRARRGLRARSAAASGGAPLPERAFAARAQHERQLAHRQARRRAARRLRPDRRQPGIAMARRRCAIGCHNPIRHDG